MAKKDQENKNIQKQSSDVQKASKVKPGFTNSKLRIVSSERPWYKSPMIWLLILFILTATVGKFLTLDSGKNEVDFGTFISRVKEKDFKKIEVNEIAAKLYPKEEDKKPLIVVIPNQSELRRSLSEVGVDPTTKEIYFKHPSDVDILSILSTVSLLVFIGVIAFSFFSAKNIATGGPMMGFGDSKARLFVGRKQDIKFEHVKGADEAVEEVREIVQFLKNPQKFLKLGARIPKGVLLVGSPGTGKTLLARAIAGEAQVPFFFTSGSEFEEMLVGAGASRVRDLFSKAKKSAPSIIFIDEIDSIAKKRGMVLHSGNTEQTLNQILVEMDGFDQSTNTIVIAATNRPDVLDPAILRPGRFDRRVVLELPDLKGREDILKYYAQNKPLAADVDLSTTAKRTIGFSGADLENMMNEAAIIAAKAGRNEVSASDIEEAATKVTLGPAKKRVKSDRQKRVAAFHEAGHAISGFYAKGADKVHRVDIISRGFTGGVTMYLPDEDEFELRTEEKFKAELITLFGGRSAEKIFFDSVTTGASSDIKRATQVARDMVKKYGMSSLGYINLDEDQEYYGPQKPYSDRTAEEIDAQVSKIIEEASKQSEEILRQNKDKLEKLANILIEKEAIDGEEFYEFMKANS